MVMGKKKKSATVEEFVTSNGIKAKAFFDEEGFCIDYKIVSKVGRMHYYSALNDVGLEAEERFKFRTDNT